MGNNDRKRIIYEVLTKINPTKYYKGFHQLKTAIELVLENEALLGKLSKEVYPIIAEKYNCSTSSVERNIRTFIRQIDSEMLSEITGSIIPEHVTVKQFIYILVVHIQKNFLLSEE